jgi:hypothetical protein
MAPKLKIARFVRGIPTPGAMPPRRTQSKPSGLYLLELRAHLPQGSLPKRKLVIATDPKLGEDGQPQPIKITHT